MSTRTHASNRAFVDRRAALAAVDALRDAASTYDFELLSYVFMPDHAHFIVIPGKDRSISSTMRIIKGAIAKRFNAVVVGRGAVWQTGFFDEVPRTVDDLNQFIRYIENNPVKSRLVTSPEAYEFSSARGQCLDAYYRFLEHAPSDTVALAKADRAGKTARAEGPRYDGERTNARGKARSRTP